MYGSPAYQINTATLGLHAEYTLFQTQCHRLPICPTLGYSSHMHYTGIFGEGWRLNYAALLQVDVAAQKLLLFKGSGQPASYALQRGAPGPKGRYLSLLKGAQTPLIEYRDCFTFYDAAQEVWYKFNKFDGDSFPDELLDRYSNKLIFRYDAKKRLVAMQDSAGREMRLVYNASGLCESFALPDGRECRIEYEGKRLSCIWNFAGIPTRFAYENGLLSRIVHGKTPRTTLFAYTTQNEVPQISAVTNPAGGVTKYNRNGNQVRVTTPAGRFRVYTSSNGLTSSVTNVAGKTLYEYRGGLRVAQTDKNGRRTEREYDGHGHVISEPSPGGGQMRYAYDAGGHRVSETGPQGETVRYENNVQGDPLAVFFPDGSTLHYVYDANGMPLREAQSNGRVVEKAYDRFGNLISVRDSLGQIAAYRYDSFGYSCTAIFDGMNRETGVLCDELGRLIELRHPQGARERYRYNCCALVEYTDCAGNSWYTERDAMSRSAKRIDPIGSISGASFDPDGIPLTETDENGNRISYVWDAAGFCAETHDPMGNVVKIDYDSMGEPVSLTDERGNTSLLTQTQCGVERITTPDGRNAQWSYDLHGRISTESLASGARMLYQYDSMGRLRELKAGNEHFSVKHDGARSSTVYNTPLGSYTTTQDMRARPLTSVAPDGLSLAYRWNNDDTLAALRYPDGLQASYAYDACGRPIGLSCANASLSYEYDAVGNILTERCANDVKVSYTYDACQRMTGMRIEKNADVLYAASWRYDSAGNLLHEEVESAFLSGNTCVASTPIQAEYDADNQLTYLNGKPCVKDGDGNLTKVGALQCGYNARGKLVKLQTPDASKTYIYGEAAMPAEVRRDNNNIEKRYYDSLGRLLCRKATDATWQFLWVGGLLAGVVINGESLYYHRDRSGNIVLVTDKTGAPVCAYAYMPFGEKRASVERISGNPFTFMGAFGVTDEGNGIFLTGYRAYYSAIGRFLQPDPQWFADGTNRYVYALNNPLRYIDPFGDIALSAMLAGAIFAYSIYGIAKSAVKAKMSYEKANEHKKAIEQKVQKFNTAKSLEEMINAQNEYKQALYEHEPQRITGGMETLRYGTETVARIASKFVGKCF